MPDVASKQSCAVGTTWPSTYVSVTAGAIRTDGATVSRLSSTSPTVWPPSLSIRHSAKTIGSSKFSVKGVTQALTYVCDSGSSQLQLTVTSLVYQPFAPSVPLTWWVTTGGVMSRYQNA